MSEVGDGPQPSPESTKEQIKTPDYKSFVPEDNWLGVTPEELDNFPSGLAREIAINAAKPPSLLTNNDLSKLHESLYGGMIDDDIKEPVAAYFLAKIANQAEEMQLAQASSLEYSLKVGDMALIHNEERQDLINVGWRLDNIAQSPWFLQADESFKTQITARVRLLGAVGIKREGKLDDIVKNPSLTMRREEFKELMSCEGVWSSLRHMFQDLFEEDESAKGYFGIKLKMPSEERDDPRNANNILNKIDDYRKDLRKKMKEEEGLNELQSRRAVAIAYNLLFVGDAIESADKDRQCYDFVTFSSPDRAFFHPADQARAKWDIIADDEKGIDPEKLGYDEEWGGNIGDWVIFRRETDSQFENTLVNEGKIKPFTKLPFPETMMVSLFEFIKVKDSQENEINLAEALLSEDVGLDQLNLDGLNAEVFGTWRDSARTAYKVYKFLTNEGPGSNDFDFTVLRGALHKLIKPNSDLPLQEVYSDPEYIAWCILGYFGLDLNTSTPLVNKIALGSMVEENYGHFLKDKALKQLGLSKEKIDRISRLISASDMAIQRSFKRGFKAFFENW